MIAALSRYQHLVPIPGYSTLTLGEGDTPLIQSCTLGPTLGLTLHFKHEGANPTGSFKDRGMVVAVARARAAGARGVICASTGNTAASAAAYAARSGLTCAIVLPAGAVAAGKLAQAALYGAKIAEVGAGFDRCLELVRDLTRDGDQVLVNSVNPDRLDGQATAAYEICDRLGRAPDAVVLPVGNAGNVTALARGFARYRQAGKIDREPRLYGVQAAGAAPLVSGASVDEPRTVASAIRIGRPASAAAARSAVEGSGGRFIAVTDEHLVAAGRRLGRREGIGAEPASCISLAGLESLATAGDIGPGELVVAVLTGHALKDPMPLVDPVERTTLSAEADAVRGWLGRRGQ